MKKKTLIRSVLFAFLCCIMILGFKTEAEAAGQYYIKINKATNVVTVYTQDNRPYTAFVCSTGSATPIGTFYTPQKYVWHMLDGPSYGQYCTTITGNFLFHSVWYYQQSKTTQSYEQYNKLGTTASHGCVRLTVAAAKWIYDNCPLQTKVIIFNGGSGDDPLGKPSFIRVSTSQSMGWDPTDPDPNNVYSTKNTQPRITAASTTVKLQYGAGFQPVSLAAYDSAGNALSSAWIRTSGSVNTGKAGNYPVTYSVTDSFGRNASVTVTYQVGDVEKATISGVRHEITKEYRSTLALRKGITAKNALGTVLTDNIVTKIKKPGTTVYKKTKQTEFKLRHIGTYRVMYYLKNPSNGLVTQRYMKVIVKDTKKPVLKSKDNFADMELKAGTKTITYKKLLSGVSAKLLSGKNMTSKISVKVTDADGKTVTIAKNGVYTFSGSGVYKAAYYCTNSNKNLRTGTYKVAKKTRKIVVAKVEVAKIVHKIQTPENKTFTVTGTAINILKNVKVVTTKTMTDKTKKVSETTKNISYTITYQKDADAKKTKIRLEEGAKLILSEPGIYRITYQYADSKGNTAKRVRKLTVNAKQPEPDTEINTGTDTNTDTNTDAGADTAADTDA